MRKKVNFFALLNEQCELMVQAMTLLDRYCEEPTEAQATRMTEIEHEADEVRRTLTEELNRTYITPIDREDLFHLSRQLDEIIDYAKTSVDEIKLFRIVQNPDIAVITKNLLEMSEHTMNAVKNIEKYPNKAKDEAFLVKKYENKVDFLTKNAYATLFESDDFKAIFKYTEIYRHLNHTADVADRAMDFLLDILVKM